ncbi:MAG TPA: uL30 family ribosomal protein [Candidatus Nanoarchaeia archaeon]|nr:uL30 family ribosomal protein [Candidatus Nanoarchaeia archaeon]
MILIIRISGLVEMPSDAQETLFRMHLRRKYSAIILKETKETMDLLQKVRNFVAYGKVDSKTIEELVDKRGQSLSGKKIDAKKVAEIIEKEGILKSGIKQFFRLHPPRKGINSKSHYPKGVLGDNGEKINDLVRRML